MNTPQVNVKKEDSDVNILANPRIRVKNREKAKIHIGDKVPVITSNTTSTGVVSESVSYLDVGLKLDVEPNVLMRDDVQIRVGLEVSNIVREIRSNSGTLTYQIGTRNAGTTLRLKDGETQVLAGLISDEDRSAASRVPGLGDLPLIGRLFSSQRDERNKTEIVLLITPRVLRNMQAQQPALTEFRSGTDNAIGSSPGGGRGAPVLAAPALAAP
ncbi:MAG: type II and III secretion system protein, partial [Thiobacillus sp.]|nr:type II and III secretion system protein [Thiobacillus sp.]